jgi:hypothetical protein
MERRRQGQTPAARPAENRESKVENGKKKTGSDPSGKARRE